MPIYIDADACPVKEEVYRVARRHAVKVFVVANAPIRVPAEDLIELVVVRGGFDAADDRIVESVAAGDIVITTDIPLADRCIRAGARVLGPKGLEFTEDAIGDALATRALLEMLRQSGEFGGGPAPFARGDRSRFLAKLDELIHAVRKGEEDVTTGRPRRLEDWLPRWSRPPTGTSGRCRVPRPRRASRRGGHLPWMP